MSRNVWLIPALARLAACVALALVHGLPHAVGAQESRYDGHQQTSF